MANDVRIVRAPPSFTPTQEPDLKLKLWEALRDLNHAMAEICRLRELIIHKDEGLDMAIRVLEEVRGAAGAMTFAAYNRLLSRLRGARHKFERSPETNEGRDGIPPARHWKK